MTKARDSATAPFGTMYEAIRHWAKVQPAAPALVDVERPPIRYRELFASVQGVGAGLNRSGVGRNDRVAIVHTGGRDMALAILGIWGHATVVPMNPGSTLAELVLQMREMRVDVLAVANELDTPARRAAAMLDLPVLELESDGHGAITVTADQRRIGPIADRTGPAQPDDLALVVATSGTTSRSKLVPTRHRHLVARNSFAARALQLGADDRCLNMLRLYHSGGLGQGLTIPLLTGGSIGALTDFSVRGFFDALEAMEPTWCTGAYTFYHAIHRNLAEHRRRIARVVPHLRFMRSGTGPLNREIAAELEAAFGVPLIETYGSSEAGAVSSEPRAAERRKQGSAGPIVHDGVAILDEAGNLVPIGMQGEIAIRGPGVFDGYENEPAANDAAFVNGWYRSGDIGYLDADNHLFVTGRIKELINRGGQKITPDEIDTALLAHPDVAAAAAFPLPHPTLGEEPAAAVVLRGGSILGEYALAAFLRKRLAQYKIPRRFVFVDEIPKGPTGKIQRHKLAAAFGLTEARAAAPAANENRSASPLERRLQALWASALGLPQVGLHDAFFDLGGDSLQAVGLFLQIERALGCRLPRSVLFEASTVAEMAKHIAAAAPSRCLVPIQPDGDRPIFFAVHDRQGQILNFRALAQHLGSDQPCYGIQSVGLDGTEPPLARIEDMATRYLSEIRYVQPHGPYYLGGYSMGGLVAYEMARQLRAAGETVGVLALFDTPLRGGSSLSALDVRLSQRLRIMGQMAKTAAHRRIFGAVWRLCEAAGLAIPAPLHRPLAANLLAIRSYRLRPYGGDAVLFRAQLYPWSRKDAYDAWHTLIGGQLEIQPITGRHHEILDEPYVRVLAQELARCLDERSPRAARPAEALAAVGED